MEIYPDYFFDFRCKGKSCTDNCCIGWEIDIDEETFQYYQDLKGTLGRDLRENILSSHGVHAFILQNDRCPFLDGDFLCRVQKELGEEGLCEICREHPRFYQSYCDVEEAGLAFACEGVAEMLLSKQKPTVFCETGTRHLPPETEQAFLRRKGWISTLQDRTRPLSQRVFDAFGPASKDGGDGNARALALLLSLNHMDSHFEPFLLEGKERFEKALPLKGLYQQALLQNEYEEIAVSFLYRYGMTENALRLPEFSAFLALFSVVCISLLHRFSQTEDLLCRVRDVVWFSKEVEYDEDNVTFLYEQYQKDPSLIPSLLQVFFREGSLDESFLEAVR